MTIRYLKAKAVKVKKKGNRGEHTIIECIGTLKVTDEAGQSVTETFFGQCAC
ncbi:hypothetical protein ACE193_14375 [Bernardetia sp. OM2101]|uniref:hypothetical protein n=1 Tax=Bernardetia sp. OM2101 TaxID=3344876 RepID=UPI0035CF1A22